MFPDSEAELAQVLEALIAREPIFHRPEFGTGRADFDRMMAAEFREIGASGKVYEREFVLDLLEERHRTVQQEDLQPTGFQIQQLSADTYLLHYTLLHGTRKTRRTTVWKRENSTWVIVFHQGTIIQE